MEPVSDALGMLDLMLHPGFCVKENRIIKLNQAAAAMMLTTDEDIFSILETGREEYAQFQGGCLCLTLRVGPQTWGATVTRIGEFDVFLLDHTENQAELQAMALAAQELREPLSNVMLTADRLLPVVAEEADASLREQIARLNRGLYQMLRIVGNMSDAGRYQAASQSRMETRNICALLTEVFTKAQFLAEQAGITLHFTNSAGNVHALADSEKLERAVLNMLSNAIKFTPSGGVIEASLRRHGNRLQLSVQDSGSGIADHLRGSVYSRYLRQPTVEDGRYGIGLGMVMIRSAATQHGGTVLLDQPEGVGTRVTLTLAIRQNPRPTLQSPVLQIDYAGGRDHCLIELSECLPASVYDSKQIN